MRDNRETKIQFTLSSEMVRENDNGSFYLQDKFFRIEVIKSLRATDESQVLDVLCKHLTKEFRILIKEEATGDIKDYIELNTNLRESTKNDFEKDFFKLMNNSAGDRAKLLFTDTDSLLYEIATEDFYKDISGDVEDKLDTTSHKEIGVWVFTQQMTSITKSFGENTAALVLFYTPSAKDMKII
ncbi:unnamed protein product, partial [Pocillopora meandrina]